MPQKQKLSTEVTVEILREYLEGRISQNEAAGCGGLGWTAGRL